MRQHFFGAARMRNSQHTIRKRDEATSGVRVCFHWLHEPRTHTGPGKNSSSTKSSGRPASRLMVQPVAPGTVRAFSCLMVMVYACFGLVFGAVHGLKVLVPVYLLEDMLTTPGFVGLAMSLISVGKIITGAPAGSLIRVYGFKRSMFVGGVFLVAAFTVQGATGWLIPPPSTPSFDAHTNNSSAHGDNATVVPGEWLRFASRVSTFAELLFLTSTTAVGCGITFYFTAQHTLMTKYLQPSHRGRAFSTVGGMFRFAGIVFPPACASVALVIPVSSTLLCLAVPPAVGITCILAFLPFDPGHGARSAVIDTGHTDTANESHKGSCQTISLAWQFRKPLSTIGFLMLLLTALRSGKEILVPLIGVELSLSVVEISGAVSVSYICGTCMFPASGLLMDRFGRKVSAAVSVSGLCVGMVLLAFSTTSSMLLIASATLGLSNGLSAGLVQTFGGDLAPEGPLRGPFLGVYNLVADIGGLVAPLLAGLLTEVLSGARAASWFFVGTGIFCLAFLLFAIRETRPEPLAAGGGAKKQDAGMRNTQESSNDLETLDAIYL